VVVTEQSIDPLDHTALEDLAASLRRARPSLRFMGYQDAEEAAERLAAILLDLLGPDRVTNSFFQPVPRGGLIVLGMLSYFLDLRHDQLPPAARDDRPLVIVDDIALTGVRLHEHLDRARTTGVVVAHLASHPELRTAVERDHRVDHCVAAVDLESLADGLGKEEAARLRRMWEERLDEERVWLGGPSAVGFAWSEPDRMVWSEDPNAVIEGWRLISPELCIENRRLLGPPALDRSARAFWFPDAIAVRRSTHYAEICILDTETVVRLDGSAADMWGALGTLGDVTAAGRYLATRYDAPVDVLTRDLGAFATTLVASGLLVAAGPTG
jgi:hypothetical protein